MTVTIDELVKEHGFCLVSTEEKPFRLDEVRFNLLAYLEDYSKMGFSFVKSGDELVELRKNQESYRLFGQCFLGFFVIGGEEQIFLLCNQEGGEVFQEARVYVNSSLHTFVSSYSLFLSSIFLLKVKFYEIEQDEVEEIAANLKAQVLALEKSLEQELPFWEHMAYLIEDDGIVLRDDLFHILNKEQ
ncbi:MULTISPECIES: immunity protein [unclassified Streptococcus]|uniref:immunity protein n=1 Tax=unclassified Streptococcus TaxID=2608887 RepID=UPI0010202FD4|nr:MULTISPECIES: immunity protein [unclassified Streptococcus]MTQ41875.1 immunity protein [Streptococcus sp. BIOML-A1]RYS61129.1 immunity protein [Streptococcus sp. bf_0095]